MLTTSSIILGSMLAKEFMMEPNFSIVYLDPSSNAMMFHASLRKMGRHSTNYLEKEKIVDIPLHLVLVPGNKKAIFAGYCRPTNTLYIRFSDEDA
jgi:hypothetical protein